MTVTPSNFMEEAEKLLRREIPLKGLSVWRGTCSGFFVPLETEYECLVAGFLEGEGPPHPKTSEFAVRLGGDAVLFWTENRSDAIPFGGGWNPFEQLQNAIAQIPEFE